MRFKLQLREAYYNHGYFNVPVRYSGFLGPDGSEITIIFNGKRMVGHIDRRATGTGAPRIKGYKEFKNETQLEFNFGEFAEYQILSPNSIQITKL